MVVAVCFCFVWVCVILKICVLRLLSFVGGLCYFVPYDFLLCCFGFCVFL